MRLYLKRWTGVSAGWVLSSEIVWCREPTASDSKEGHNAAHANASAARPCGVEDPRHVEKLHAREPGDPVAAREQWAGRGEKAMSHKSPMHGSGESYGGVVPTKQPNKSERSPAEVVEERPPTKENTRQSNPNRTPSRESGPSGLERVREETQQDGKLQLHPECAPTPISEVRTVCVSSASTGLCGGCRVTGIPTATRAQGAPPTPRDAWSFHPALRAGGACPLLATRLRDGDRVSWPSVGTSADAAGKSACATSRSPNICEKVGLIHALPTLPFKRQLGLTCSLPQLHYGCPRAAFLLRGRVEARYVRMAAEQLGDGFL